MAARGCRDVALAYGTPFISGKDSLYNEYTHEGKSLAIPPTLLISAIGQVPDVRKCVTMDLKEPGNILYLVGTTRLELGGSHWAMVRGLTGGRCPRVDGQAARGTFRAIHRAIGRGLVRSCHDLSEGGLAVALAEMALAGGLGVEARLDGIPGPAEVRHPAALLFSESPTRFVLEVRPEDAASLEASMGRGVPLGRIGEVVPVQWLVVHGDGQALIDSPLTHLKNAWQSPLRW